MMRTGQWAFVLCAVLSWSCDDRHLSFDSGGPNMRGTRDADLTPPDAGERRDVASGVDASNLPPVDSSANLDGGHSSDAIPVSCSLLPAGIFPSSGVTCQLVDPQAGRPFCVPDPSGDDGPLYMDFVGCEQGSPSTMGSVCSNGMCCHGLQTSFVGTPGYVCAIASGMQIIAYGKALDTDGDFIPDYRDNCPFVDNSFGQNDDDDHDGIGNACDPCPEVPGVTCADAGVP